GRSRRNTNIGSRSQPIGTRLENYGSCQLKLLTETRLRTQSALQKRQKKLLRSSCVKNSDIKPPDCNPPSAPPSLGHCSTGLVEGHRRFGRGRGNGTARRSTAVLCTSVVSSVEVGLRKAAIGSLDAGLRAGAAGPIEPVISSLVGGSLPPLIAFRSAKAPN